MAEPWHIERGMTRGLSPRWSVKRGDEFLRMDGKFSTIRRFRTEAGAQKACDKANRAAEAAAKPWDASQIKQPGWHHVEAAFIEGAREARANPEADEAMFRRAADGYTKRVFEEVDPVSEAALRTGSWKSNACVAVPDSSTFSQHPPMDSK